MRVQFFAALIFLLIGPAVAQQPKKPNPSPAIQAAPDPVQEFEKLVQKCQAIFEQHNTPAITVKYNERTSSWVRTVRSFEVRYDVKKTESLVNPIIAQLNTLDIAAVQTAADEQSAQALNFTLASSPRHIRERYAATFVWRNQSWQFKDGTSTVDFRREDGTYGNTIASALDESKGWDYYGPYGGCFQP